ncbi:MAG: putative transferase [Acidimicrobiales bacterium]|nr:putative transferase [Acidimicrobiales bacterium]
MPRAWREADPRRLLWRWRRSVLLARTRVVSRWYRAPIELDIAPDVRLGRHVRIELEPGTRNVLRIGPECQVLDRVLFMLKGGEVHIGRDARLRRDAALNVSGRFEMGDRTMLSFGCVVHCAEAVVLETMVVLSEYVTVADSRHFFTTADAWFYDNLQTAPVRIGANTWVCPRASIAAGVTIGSHCIIAANSLVKRDVPEGHIATGVPVDDLRPLRHGWRHVAALRAGGGR